MPVDQNCRPPALSVTLSFLSRPFSSEESPSTCLFLPPPIPDSGPSFVPPHVPVAQRIHTLAKNVSSVVCRSSAPRHSQIGAEGFARRTTFGQDQIDPITMSKGVWRDGAPSPSKRPDNCYSWAGLVIDNSRGANTCSEEVCE